MGIPKHPDSYYCLTFSASIRNPLPSSRKDLSFPNEFILNAQPLTSKFLGDFYLFIWCCSLPEMQMSYLEISQNHLGGYWYQAGWLTRFFEPPYWTPWKSHVPRKLYDLIWQRNWRRKALKYLISKWKENLLRTTSPVQGEEDLKKQLADTFSIDMDFIWWDIQLDGSLHVVQIVESFQISIWLKVIHNLKFHNLQCISNCTYCGIVTKPLINTVTITILNTNPVFCKAIVEVCRNDLTRTGTVAVRSVWVAGKHSEP